MATNHTTQYGMGWASLDALKSAALRAGFHAGLFRLIQFARRSQAVILTFHRFHQNGEGDTRGLAIERFAECLNYLTEHYRVVSLSELTHALKRPILPVNMAAVTIDDCYHEVFSLAAPVLRRYGVRASIFAVSGFIAGHLWLWPDRLRFLFERAPQGRIVFRHRGEIYRIEIRNERDRWRLEQAWCEYGKTMTAAEREELLDALATAWSVTLPASPPERDRPMTWTQLRTLAAQGFDVGAHTRTHPILAQVPRARLEDEIAGCKEEMEQHLGGPVRYFAYPNGRQQDYTDACVAAIVRAGYTAAVTTIPGGNTAQTPLFELRRIAERTEDLPHFAQAITGVDLFKDRLRLAFRGAAIESGGREPVAR